MSNHDPDAVSLARLSAMKDIVMAHLATTTVETDRLAQLVREVYASVLHPEPAAGPSVAPVRNDPAPLPVAESAEETSEHAAAPTPAVGTSSAAPADTAPTSGLVPAVPIRASVFPDYIVCLEDGKKLKSLKRHLSSAFGMTIQDYKAKWDLPDEYPTVAPNYAEMRRDVARKSGLGRRPIQESENTQPLEPERKDTESVKGRDRPGRRARSGGGLLRAIENH